jgi:hypothetical protein
VANCSIPSRAAALALGLLAAAAPAAGASPMPPEAVAPPGAQPLPDAARAGEVLIILDILVAQGPLPPVWEPGKPPRAGAPPAMRDGRADVAEEGLLPFPDIVARAQRQVGGALIGADYDPRRAVYRLTFLNRGVVIRVVSDARTGRLMAVESR